MGARDAIVGVRRDGLLEEPERLLEVALLPGLEGEPVERARRFVRLTWPAAVGIRLGKLHVPSASSRVVTFFSSFQTCVSLSRRESASRPARRRAAGCPAPRRAAARGARVHQAAPASDDDAERRGSRPARAGSPRISDGRGRKGLPRRGTATSAAYPSGRERRHRDRKRARAEGEIEGAVEAAAAGGDEHGDERARGSRVAADRVVAVARHEEVAAGTEVERGGSAQAARAARDEGRDEGAGGRVEGLHLAREVTKPRRACPGGTRDRRDRRARRRCRGVDEDADEGARRAVVLEHLAAGARHVEVAVRVRSRGCAARTGRPSRRARRGRATGPSRHRCARSRRRPSRRRSSRRPARRLRRTGKKPQTPPKLRSSAPVSASCSTTSFASELDDEQPLAVGREGDAGVERRRDAARAHARSGCRRRRSRSPRSRSRWRRAACSRSRPGPSARRARRRPARRAASPRASSRSTSTTSFESAAGHGERAVRRDREPAGLAARPTHAGSTTRDEDPAAAAQRVFEHAIRAAVGDQHLRRGAEQEAGRLRRAPRRSPSWRRRRRSGSARRGLRRVSTAKTCAPFTATPRTRRSTAVPSAVTVPPGRSSLFTASAVSASVSSDRRSRAWRPTRRRRGRLGPSSPVFTAGVITAPVAVV